jgi:hypothetical protein
MTTLKIDNIIFSTASGDVSTAISGAITNAEYAIITGIINPTNGNITTTGVISGGSFKTSGNVTVIDAAGGISPYGLYTLPSGVGVSGYVATKSEGTTTSWGPVPSGYSTAFSIALGKC